MKNYLNILKYFRVSLVRKFILIMGIVLFISTSMWTYLIIQKDSKQFINMIVSSGVNPEEAEKYAHYITLKILSFAVFLFIITSITIFLFVLRFVNRPIKKFILGINFIAKGDYNDGIDIKQDDEIGKLADAFNKMCEKFRIKQVELNRQKDEYQNLFDGVPCTITVQDKDYKLVGYNREFADKFDPKQGDFCFYAYKGRSEKCPNCPVEKTFEDGLAHYSEERGFNRDGSLAYWVVKTSPIKNPKGEIIAAMEMCLDITESKLLEFKLEQSKKKYYAIFNNIPNPVFVLDADTLKIIDFNESVKNVYGYDKNELINKSFLELFKIEEKDKYYETIKRHSLINLSKHIIKDDTQIFVNIKISPSEYPGQKVLLVTTSDETKRIETEHQLIQASKMATLGQMATGIAHELNQPLSVIKTASSFFMKKIKKNEPIKDEILFTMAQEIDNHVDRASKIINHMRQFGRKSEMSMENVQINEVLKRAFEIFNQQLKLREIEVVWELTENIPLIQSDSTMLEQVFVNLLLNARDAIEEKWENKKSGDKKITIATKLENKNAIIEICDTGTGIPEAFLDKIFEPFFTTKKVGKGTGLGLSISYGIIKECGGSIKATSKKDEGSCFIINFPILKLNL
ncbi:MAG: PAS domain S-box protein [Desulfobacterales bacterium]|nr:PAS domain S-box protein [Desulfobacterales bacterium]